MICMHYNIESVEEQENVVTEGEECGYVLNQKENQGPRPDNGEWFAGNKKNFFCTPKEMNDKS